MRSILSDDSAQSSVIGTILLVAIVVILASVIGIFAIDLYQSAGDVEESPDVRFDAEQYGGDHDQFVRMYHMTGNTIGDLDTISVVVDGETVSETGADWSNSNEGLRSQSSLYIAADGSGFTTADNADFGGSSPDELDPGTEISVIWSSADADTSATLFEYEVEDR
ncbi:type IV pilin [Natranaeroarchaeum aerophilus]|uniref:Type IV pilin N-terminal domain-containing protein n=1 Tax=Natranaeroarchaeum aerophilus TaxID=2917711 RepID=A0AAE3K4E7_9EURY|nr:type IV pilin N-terminal domain-containing protein [Natranaeroarchaeum aerophilus]MCL9812575.1 type IV pilin N-terminal domain-containing protein [Natranaeroarchaeum aerophilus]